jgi:hypothetical protein
MLDNLGVLDANAINSSIDVCLTLIISYYISKKLVKLI